MNESDYRRKLKNQLITYRNSLDLSSDVTFGVEIELENIEFDAIQYYLEELKNDYPILKGWSTHYETDIIEHKNSNIAMNGEIVSSILTDKKENWDILEEVLIFFDKKGAIVTDKCGGHINIGGHVIGNNIENIKNLLILWKTYYKYIYSFSSGEFNQVRSHTSQIAQPLPISFNDVKRTKILYMLTREIFSKFNEVWISDELCNTFEESNRIEFRLPNSTLRPEIWQNYINFFSKLLIASKKPLDREKLIYNYNKSNINVEDFIDYIFDKQIDKENFLIQSLKTNKVYKKELPHHIIYKDNSISF